MPSYVSLWTTAAQGRSARGAASQGAALDGDHPKQLPFEGGRRELGRWFAHRPGRRLHLVAVCHELLRNVSFGVQLVAWCHELHLGGRLVSGHAGPRRSSGQRYFGPGPSSCWSALRGLGGRPDGGPISEPIRGLGPRGTGLPSTATAMKPLPFLGGRRELGRWLASARAVDCNSWLCATSCCEIGSSGCNSWLYATSCTWAVVWSAGTPALGGHLVSGTSDLGRCPVGGTGQVGSGAASQGAALDGDHPKQLPFEGGRRELGRWLAHRPGRRLHLVAVCHELLRNLSFGVQLVA